MFIKYCLHVLLFQFSVSKGMRLSVSDPHTDYVKMWRSISDIGQRSSGRCIRRVYPTGRIAIGSNCSSLSNSTLWGFGLGLTSVSGVVLFKPLLYSHFSSIRSNTWTTSKNGVVPSWHFPLYPHNDYVKKWRSGTLLFSGYRSTTRTTSNSDVVPLSQITKVGMCVV